MEERREGRLGRRRNGNNIHVRRIEANKRVLKNRNKRLRIDLPLPVHKCLPDLSRPSS